MKIIFCGTPEITEKTLEELTKHPDSEILAVITQPDKPFGRKLIPTPTPIKRKALELGIKVFEVDTKIKLEKIIEKQQPDLVLVFAYGVIFNEKTLNIPKYGCINVHASLLPKYRGASPIQQAILEGETKTGISIIKMSKEMDKGDVYIQYDLHIEESDTYTTLSRKISKLSALHINEVLKEIVEGKIKALPQDESKKSYCEKLTKEDGKINWTESGEKILRKIKALNEWPKTYTFYKNKKITILEAKLGIEKLPPGKVVIKNGTLNIGTKTNTIFVSMIQLEGGKAMNVKDFTNGFGRNLDGEILI